MRRQIPLLLTGILAAGLSLASWYFFYIRYFAWRNCFNELGRCYDPDGTRQVYTTAGMTWALPGAFFRCAGCFLDRSVSSRQGFAFAEVSALIVGISERVRKMHHAPWIVAMLESERMTDLVHGLLEKSLAKSGVVFRAAAK